MIIFKTFARIARHTKKALIMPLIIFVGFTFISKLNVVKQVDEFTMTVPRVAITNEDTQGDVAQGLMNYLDGRVEFVNVAPEKLEDHLYYRDVYFATTIPQGFSQDIVSGKISFLTSQMILDSSNGYLVESMINDYLTNVQVLINTGKTPAEAIEIIKTSTTDVSHVDILKEDVDKDLVMSEFARYELYPVMLTICTVITTLLTVFTSVKIKTRTMVSSTSSRSQNAQLFAGTLIIGHVLWIILRVISLVLLKDYIHMETLGLRLFNSYLFFIVTLAFSFFVSKLVTSPSARIAVLNSATLGLSFLSGVFVPQHLMNSTIVTISKLFPLYWNVQITELITAGTTTFNDLILPTMIQLGFAAAFVVIALIVSRERSFKSVSASIN